MDRDAIQGIVTDEYRSLPFARYHLLGFGAGEPRQVLARLVTEVSSSAERRASSRLQFALSAPGLGALGLKPQLLAQFPREFRQGMAHPERSAALGDVAGDAPVAWEFGGPRTTPLDALCMTYAGTSERLDELGGARERLFERFGLSVRTYDAEALAAPSVGGSGRRAPRLPRGQRVPLGEFVLGERDVLGERQRGPFVPIKYGTRPMPEWSRRERALDFGQSGSYLVLRKLCLSAPFEAAAVARLAAEHTQDALVSANARAHRLLQRSRSLPDGLWFMALNASIRRQFEFVQQTQRNEPGLGGARYPSFQRPPGRTAANFRHYRVCGGAYLFLPGIPALNYLAEPGGGG